MGTIFENVDYITSIFFLTLSILASILVIITYLRTPEL
jgi:hypothetical protein